jgi:hypothetical protein
VKVVVVRGGGGSPSHSCVAVQDSKSYSHGTAMDSTGAPQPFDLNALVFTDNDGTRITLSRRCELSDTFTAFPSFRVPHTSALHICVSHRVMFIELLLDRNCSLVELFIIAVLCLLLLFLLGFCTPQWRA